MLFVSGWKGVEYERQNKRKKPARAICADGNRPGKDGQETEKEAGESEKFAAFCSSHSMTPRECDVMKLILSSDENMKILSEKLGISERMLYRYMNSLYSKVGTENRAGLIKKYYEL